MKKTEEKWKNLLDIYHRRNAPAFLAAAAIIRGGGGILGFLLSGCFIPITVDIPEENPVWNAGRADAWQEPDPFEVEVWIRERAGNRNTVHRSIAGPGGKQLAIGEHSIRNFLQLIVLNKDGKIVEVIKDRRTDDSYLTELAVKNIFFGKPYSFLLLMGHWERDYTAKTGEQYRYKNSLPTLLAADCRRFSKGNKEVVPTRRRH